MNIFRVVSGQLIMGDEGVGRDDCVYFSPPKGHALTKLRWG